jgi:two-component system LytT family response regulator
VLAQPIDLINVLVVDDEKPARQRLIDLLHKDSQVGAIFEVADGMAAIEAIQKQRFDLVLPDAQMPEADGLAVIDAVGADQMPLTIFVTAYDQHAIRAFEANALDYLLKPFSDQRFEAAMARVKVRLDVLLCFSAP